MGDKQEKGFVVKDRRFFDETGDVRNAEEIKEDKKATAEEEKKAQEAQEAAATEDIYPEINFTSFVLSLSTTAMYHFGDFPDPVSGKVEKNLPAAKQTIDILGMLKDKTAGNLDDNEKNLLEGMLFDLRMRYVREKGT